MSLLGPSILLVHALLIKDKSLREKQELYEHLENIKPINIGGETIRDRSEVIVEPHIHMMRNRGAPDEVRELYNKCMGE